MTHDPIQHLHDILLTQERWHEPWTSGTIDLSTSESTLFFKCTDGSSGHLQLGSTTEADLQALIAASQPATFGRGPENVLNRTYRKAWKLDAGSFSWLFNPDSGRFIAELARGFCPWDRFDRGIRLEPYKLNVYGKGDFFKSHRDTPHAQDMFGSLVFVLPVEHHGGHLVLRHRDREFNFDAPSLLNGKPSTTAAYIAFYSDVEHEVLEVLSGHRVTITFNLYFDPSRSPPLSSLAQPRIPENHFTTALREKLGDRSFHRSHRYLGFGLEYAYPKRADEYVGNLVHCLKGPDAFLHRILAGLGTQPQLKYLYRSEYGSCDFWIMCNHTIEGRHTNEASSETELEYLLAERDTKIVWAKGKTENSSEGARAIYRRHPWFISYFDNVDRYRARTLPVDWVTEPSDNLVGRTTWVELGNEPAHEIYYYAVCILVDLSKIPPT